MELCVRMAFVLVQGEDRLHLLNVWSLSLAAIMEAVVFDIGDLGCFCYATGVPSQAQYGLLVKILIPTSGISTHPYLSMCVERKPFLSSLWLGAQFHKLPDDSYCGLAYFQFCQTADKWLFSGVNDPFTSQEVVSPATYPTQTFMNINTLVA